jgi:hypothetical protein
MSGTTRGEEEWGEPYNNTARLAAGIPAGCVARDPEFGCYFTGDSAITAQAVPAVEMN